MEASSTGDTNSAVEPSVDYDVRWSEVRASTAICSASRSVIAAVIVEIVPLAPYDNGQAGQFRMPTDSEGEFEKDKGGIPCESS